MANRTIHIALDLGSDTIKVAYAYRDGGSDRTGKIVGDPLGMTAIPSVAYFDTDEKRWLFGDDVDTVGDKPFITVVKICDLLRLLQPADKPATQKSNNDYYFKRNRFPKFYFPQREVLTDDMDAAVRHERTFTADGTPSEVCERFFEYVKDVVNKRLSLLLGGDEITVEPCLVYPAFSDGNYTKELKRLVKNAFGKEPKTIMSMAKALCAYAKYSNRLKSSDKSVIFNIGEERTSLVKVTFSGSGISIDGVDGHNPPAQIGGKDIDDAVAAYIEGQMSGRETMGRPSSGEEGHISESASNTKQYLFVKDIKSAKIVLGMAIYESRAFRDGVPISASRDLLVQRSITREQFEKCIGTDGSGGIASKFVDYIKEELARPINSDVKKIFITGGPVETYGLIPYIRKSIKPLGVDVFTFEKDDSEYVGVKNDGFNIMSHEDALYAPAIGCAVASLNNMTIDMVLALTYGIRLYRVASGNNVIPFFRVLVDKGTRVPQNGATYLTPKDGEKGGITTGDDSEESAAMHIMSTFYSAEDIAHSRKAPLVTYYKSGNENLLVVDTGNKTMMKKLQNEIGLQVLNGDISDMNSGSRAKYYYKGRPIKILHEVYLQFGVEIDGDGYAKAYAQNDKKRNGSGVTKIVFLDGKGQSSGANRPSGNSKYNTDPFAKNISHGNYSANGMIAEEVPKRDIEFKFMIETQLT